jgi:hypothetical protein
LYFFDTLETICGTFQHAAPSKHTSDQGRVVAYSYFRFPTLRRDQPLAIFTLSFAPARPIGNRMRRSAKRLESGIAMLLDKKAHLRDGSVNFTSLFAAAGIVPIVETPAGCVQGLAFLPGSDAKFAR